MRDCASILDSIAKGIPCFHYFSHGASLHLYPFTFALVYTNLHEVVLPWLSSGGHEITQF